MQFEVAIQALFHEFLARDERNGDARLNLVVDQEADEVGKRRRHIDDIVRLRHFEGISVATGGGDQVDESGNQALNGWCLAVAVMMAESLRPAVKLSSLSRPMKSLMVCSSSSSSVKALAGASLGVVSCGSVAGLSSRAFPLSFMRHSNAFGLRIGETDNSGLAYLEALPIKGLRRREERREVTEFYHISGVKAIDAHPDSPCSNKMITPHLE